MSKSNITFLALVISLFAPLTMFAYGLPYQQNQRTYEQQYVTATPDTPTQQQPKSRAQPQRSKQPLKQQQTTPSPQNNNPVNIFVKQQPQQNSRHSNQWQMHPQNPQQIQPQLQPQQRPNTIKRYQAPRPTLQQNNPTTQTYATEEQQVWYKSCLGAVSNKKVAPFARAFCDCGWEEIANGRIPLKLLTSKSSADIQKANRLFKVISQICLAKVMATQNGKN